MLGFMDYVQHAFYGATDWDRDNSYGRLTITSRNILDFEIPQGLRLHVSSLASPNFASAYTVSAIGLVDGSLSYLYTSRALEGLISRSNAIDLRDVVHGYRRLAYLKPLPESVATSWLTPRPRTTTPSDTKNTLLYGRLFLPHSTLEALYLRQLDSRTLIKISAVSDSRLPSGGSVLAHLQHDTRRHCTEWVCSTDGALLGFRGLYNFGAARELTSSSSSALSLVSTSTSSSIPSSPLPTASPSSSTSSTTQSLPPGRLSLGGEIYYGLLNKSGGCSLGMRFATLQSHPGFPYCMTLTVNPLMGNLSSTYSVLAARELALSTRFAFNVYSYESEVQLGMELWRRATSSRDQTVRWARRKMHAYTNNQLFLSDPGEDETTSCVKARLDQRGVLGVLWHGRLKELLLSAGVNLDLQGGEHLFRGVGVEVSYSS